jgi:peptidoglycan/xylan/chitin deacetylase (PgdA/CDA1 family)
MVTYWVKTPSWLKKVFPKKLIWDMPHDGAPTVYITFDDGPHPTATPFALEQLEQYNALATFFCVGNNVVKFPEVYEQVLRMGHTAANHTYNHMNGWKTDNNTYIANIAKAKEYIDSYLFRPPYGKIKPSQIRALAKNDARWKIIMWDVLSGDFDRQLSPEKCLKNVLDNIRPGSIILFHDSEKAWDRMSYALPRVLEYCKEKNWQMKALS